MSHVAGGGQSRFWIPKIGLACGRLIKPHGTIDPGTICLRRSAARNLLSTALLRRGRIGEPRSQDDEVIENGIETQ